MNPARLLLIEDDTGIAMALTMWLQAHARGSILLDHVETIEHGLSRAKGSDAILLDLILPGSPGIDHSLKQISRLREFAPVIVLTGYSDGQPFIHSKFISDAVSENGADFVFPKSMLMEHAGTEWLFLNVQAAIGRRIYAGKRESGLNSGS